MSDPTPPRPTDYSASADSGTGVNIGRINRASSKGAAIGLRESIATINTAPQPKVADPAEARLWRIAGGLMVLAIGVLGVLGWLTFAPNATASPTVAHADPIRVPATEPTHRAAAPSVAAPEPTVVSAAKQRPNKHHGKEKAHKRARLAKRR